MIKIFQNEPELFKSAAAFIIDVAAKAIKENGRFSLVLSGGSTPSKLFELLATPAYAAQLDWSKTFVFWGDERYAPFNDKLNNAKTAKELLLDKVPIPAENIFRIPVGPSPAVAADIYEQTVKDFFKNSLPDFDLVLLGMGDNAHIADILNETTRLVKEVYVEEQQMFRITMTAPLINLAKNIVFLLTGKAKAQTFKTVLNAPYQPSLYPVQLIKPVNGELYWFADAEAASLL
jgi:6-phosphogluconolactonase